MAVVGPFHTSDGTIASGIEKLTIRDSYKMLANSTFNYNQACINRYVKR